MGACVMRIVWLVLLGLSLFASDIQSLQREKRQYKQHRAKQSSLHMPTAPQIVILFRDENGSTEEVQRHFGIVLESCVTKNLCIFTLARGQDVVQAIKEIKKHNAVQRASIHKRQHFSPY